MIGKAGILLHASLLPSKMPTPTAASCAVLRLTPVPSICSEVTTAFRRRALWWQALQGRAAGLRIVATRLQSAGHGALHRTAKAVMPGPDADGMTDMQIIINRQCSAHSGLFRSSIHALSWFS